jgi:hypothetical protein
LWWERTQDAAPEVMSRTFLVYKHQIFWWKLMTLWFCFARALFFFPLYCTLTALGFPKGVGTTPRLCHVQLGTYLVMSWTNHQPKG